MGTISSYAFAARDAFAGRTLGRVDSLCLSCLSYLRFAEEPRALEGAGVRLVNLADSSTRSRLVASLHDVQAASLLLQAMAHSERFGDVQACLHVNDLSEEEGCQFSATTFVLPDGAGAYVAFRGTDDTLLGWKENIRLACAEPVGAQKRAVSYLEDVASAVEGPLWVGGHSKGGNLAEYACGMASDAVRARITCCFTHDGPGLNAQVRQGCHDDVPIDKTVPRESLVGMLFERSQQHVSVVRSDAVGVMQHDPYSWQVTGNDFVLEQGLSYDAWRLSQRINDWLDNMSTTERTSFVELLCWLADVTGETNFSDLLRRWSSNTQAMQAALEAGPAGDRELFTRAMDDLVATVLLGSRQELGLDVDETPQGHAQAAQRRLEDASARVADRLSRIDRFL